MHRLLRSPAWLPCSRYRGASACRCPRCGGGALLGHPVPKLLEDRLAEWRIDHEPDLADAIHGLISRHQMSSIERAPFSPRISINRRPAPRVILAFSICGATGPAQWKRSLPALIPSAHDRRRVGPAARRQSLRRWTFGRQDCKTSCRLGEVSCSRLVSSADRPFSLPPVQKCQASSCHVFVNLRSTRSVTWWVCSPGIFDPPVPRLYVAECMQSVCPYPIG